MSEAPQEVPTAPAAPCPQVTDPTGDEIVDEALAELPEVPAVHDAPSGDDLQVSIDRADEVHRRLQQRLSDLSR